MEITTIVVLLDQDTVFGDGRHGDAIVGDALDGSRCAGFGLYADSCFISLATISQYGTEIWHTLDRLGNS